MFEGAGLVTDHVGGYSDWYARGNRLQDAVAKNNAAESAAVQPVEAVKNVVASVPEPAKQKKLSYKLQRELDELPAIVEKLETEIEQFNKEAAAPDFYTRDHARVAVVLDGLEKKQAELDAKMERWLELEAMQEGA